MRTLANLSRPVSVLLGIFVLSVMIISLVPKTAKAADYSIAWFSFGPVCTNDPGTDC